MERKTVYAIIAVVVLLVTAYSVFIVVGLADNPLAPNHFVGSWIGTDQRTEGQETWTFQRPMLG